MHHISPHLRVHTPLLNPPSSTQYGNYCCISRLNICQIMWRRRGLVKNKYVTVVRSSVYYKRKEIQILTFVKYYSEKKQLLAHFLKSITSLNKIRCMVIESWKLRLQSITIYVYVIWHCIYLYYCAAAESFTNKKNVVSCCCWDSGRFLNITSNCEVIVSLLNQGI